MVCLVASTRAVSSFGFSGAGFLTSYHLGAAECLLKHGLLLLPGELPQPGKTPVLTGVSGGALVATAVSLGVRPEDGMSTTLAIAERTRTMGGLLDHLPPGFSLVDQVEAAIIKLVRDVDEEFALRRIEHGRLLRIGLTDSRTFPRFRRNPNAYIYVDKYDNLEQVISACILSSYVPGLTGPLPSQKSLERNGAVRRANETLLGMLEKGFIKNSIGLPLQEIDDGRKIDSLTPHQNDVMFWDGGMANVFPIIDRDTCIVTPLSGHFRYPSISPSPLHTAYDDELERSWARPEICLENLRTLRYIAFSSERLALEKWFEAGFNDANKFLIGINMTSHYATSSYQVVNNFQ